MFLRKNEYFFIFLESCAKLCGHFLVSGLAEEGEHILLVRFNTGLVEGIYVENVARNSTSELEEIDHIAKCVCASLCEAKNYIGNLAVNMCEKSAVHSGAVNLCHRHTGEEVKSVDVRGIIRNLCFAIGSFNGENGFEDSAQTRLHVLTEGVKIGREDYGGGIESLTVLALAFTVKLLPPLAEHLLIGLVANEDLGDLTLAVKDITECGVSVSIIGINVACGKCGHSISRAAHKLVEIDAGNCDGKKSYCGEDREASADVVRYYEGLVACISREGLESSACLIGGNEDALLCAFLAVLVFKPRAEISESNSGLGGSTRLGDYVNANVTSLADSEKLVEIAAADVTAGEIDIGSILLEKVVSGRTKEFDYRAGSEI